MPRAHPRKLRPSPEIGQASRDQESNRQFPLRDAVLHRAPETRRTANSATEIHYCDLPIRPSSSDSCFLDSFDPSHCTHLLNRLFERARSKAHCKPISHFSDRLRRKGLPAPLQPFLDRIEVSALFVVEYLSDHNLARTLIRGRCCNKEVHKPMHARARRLLLIGQPLLTPNRMMQARCCLQSHAMPCTRHKKRRDCARSRNSFGHNSTGSNLRTGSCVHNSRDEFP